MFSIDQRDVFMCYRLLKVDKWCEVELGQTEKNCYFDWTARFTMFLMVFFKQAMADYCDYGRKIAYATIECKTNVGTY